MKERQNVLPCGRVYFFMEENPGDMVLHPTIRLAIMREEEELRKFSNYENAGRKRKVWRKNVYNKFLTLLTKKVVDHLMESDRIKTQEGRMWCFGTVQTEKDKYLNWETDGAVIALMIQGIPGNYRMTLSRKRGMELHRRIKAGQKFHNHIN